MPAGVGEARVFAAAAEWLLLHAAPPAPPDAMCAPLQTGAPSGGAKASAGRGDELDLFSLIHKMLWPLANAPLHVQAMGMADLPPEASPMQIYEWLSATDPLVRELHSAEHAMRHAEVVPSDCREVRSGFRGGVEAIRGGALRRKGSWDGEECSKCSTRGYIAALMRRCCTRAIGPELRGARAQAGRRAAASAIAVYRPLY